MDKLEKIFKEQKSFQYHFYDPDSLAEKEKIYFSKEFILCMHRELGEILNVIPWKIHRKNKKKYNPDYLKEELIDCFKYLINLCLIWQVDSKELYKLFLKKSKVVKERYKNEQKNEK